MDEDGRAQMIHHAEDLEREALAIRDQVYRAERHLPGIQRSDIAINLLAVAHGAAHQSGKFAPCIFVGVMPVWEGLPTFDTQGEAVAVAEAKATLVFRRLFAEAVPFEFAKDHDDSLLLEALAALEQTEQALAEQGGS